VKLIIVNRRPGMIRGGRSHPPVASYSAAEAVAAFSPEQLADIAGEPEMTVVVGEEVAVEQAAEVTALLQADADKAPRAKK
jgi:hypothetical protein